MTVLAGLFLGLGAALLVWGKPEKTSNKEAVQKLSWGQRRSELLLQAGIHGVSSAQLLSIQFGAFLTAAFPVWIISRSLSVAACFGVFAFFAPVALVRAQRKRRMRELREMWPELVDNLASAVRAGMGLPEAVSALAERGPEPLRPAFASFAANYRVSGQFNTCLDALKERLADPVADRVCESLRLAREVGGTELGQLLRTLSEFLREDGRTRSEIETRQGWTVNAARLAVAAPWLVLLLLATQAGTLEAFDTFMGRVVIVGGAALSIVAYRLMVRIGKLPEEKRVLR